MPAGEAQAGAKGGGGGGRGEGGEEGSSSYSLAVSPGLLWLSRSSQTPSYLSAALGCQLPELTPV